MNPLFNDYRTVYIAFDTDFQMKLEKHWLKMVHLLVYKQIHFNDAKIFFF